MHTRARLVPWLVFVAALCSCQAGDEAVPEDGGSACALDIDCDPPKLTQMFMEELVTIEGVDRRQMQLAFGDDPSIPAEADDREVRRASFRYGSGPIWLVFSAPLDRQSVEFLGGPGLRVDLVRFVCDGVELPHRQEYGIHHEVAGVTIAEGITTTGPALEVLVGGLRSGSECQVEFNAISGKSGYEACAPLNGNAEASCLPGDSSLVTFATEPLRLVNSFPQDGAADVAEQVSTFMLLAFNAPIDVESHNAVSLLAEGVEVPMSIEAQEYELDDIIIRSNQTLAPETEHIIRVRGGAEAPLSDLLGGALQESVEIRFTTGSY